VHRRSLPIGRVLFVRDGASEDVTSDLTPVDFGIAFGSGFEHRRLSLEARYTLGLRTVFHDGDLEGTFKNRALSVLAGLRLGR
jgi:hypothetical protein